MFLKLLERLLPTAHGNQLTRTIYAVRRKSDQAIITTDLKEWQAEHYLETYFPAAVRHYYQIVVREELIIPGDWKLI